MPELDSDLVSIQEVRRLCEKAREAHREVMHFSQVQIDQICEAMADAAFSAAAPLAELAVNETTYGVVSHKIVKNEFSSRNVWESIRDLKTVGVVRRDEGKKIVEIAWRFGVIAAFTPSTNPTSTAMYKILIATKTRNAVVLSPHPSAVQSSEETVRVMAEAGERAGMPRGLISSLSKVTMPALQELMHHWAVNLILATGGSAVVNAAHSSGKPAIGVGPGNVPVYVDRSADVAQAARDIVDSKSFDNSTICASEQSVIVDAPIEQQLVGELEKNGAYFMDEAQIAAMSRVIHRADGMPNPKAVGQSPQVLAGMAGIRVPETARVLMARLPGIGPEYPLSREKLTTVLAFYVVSGWQEGCDLSIKQLKFGGDGHTLVIHCRDENIVMQFGLEKPSFRILVNTMATLGAVGYTTNLDPSMTLATGGIGGGVFSDNITARHLMNIKRVAWGVRSWSTREVEAKSGQVTKGETASGGTVLSYQQLELIVKQTVREARST